MENRVQTIQSWIYSNGNNDDIKVFRKVRLKCVKHSAEASFTPLRPCATVIDGFSFLAQPVGPPRWHRLRPQLPSHKGFFF